MPAFPKPNFPFQFDLTTEKQSLRAHKTARGIPDSTPNSVLIASWNIANLGLQKREQKHYQLIAEIASWFDVIAIQEVNVDLSGLQEIKRHLPDKYKIVFTDKAGNNERFAFVYDADKLTLAEMFGEVAIPPKDHRYIKIAGITKKFTGFDRNPCIATFKHGDSVFALINVHSFFGSESKSDVERRALETYAISRYADLTGNSKHAYTDKIMALGDFNLPKVEQGDLIYEALLKRGLKLPKHSTKVYSNISDDKMYDQIAFLPSMKKKIVSNGVFDFDSVVFSSLWQESKRKFRSYTKYYLSDHRPIWMQIEF